MTGSASGCNTFDQLLSAEDVAQWLKVPISTVRNKGASGEIPSVKIGRHRRYDRSEVQRWIDGQRQEQQAA